MKKFLIGFFGMAAILLALVGFPILGANLAKHFGYDEVLGVGLSFGILVCTLVGLVFTFDDDNDNDNE